MKIMLCANVLLLCLTCFFSSAVLAKSGEKFHSSTKEIIKGIRNVRIEWDIARKVSILKFIFSRPLDIEKMYWEEQPTIDCTQRYEAYLKPVSMLVTVNKNKNDICFFRIIKNVQVNWKHLNACPGSPKKHGSHIAYFWIDVKKNIIKERKRDRKIPDNEIEKLDVVNAKARVHAPNGPISVGRGLTQAQEYFQKFLIEKYPFLEQK